VWGFSPHRLIPIEISIEYSALDSALEQYFRLDKEAGNIGELGLIGRSELACR
jgi:hypothetical protein